MKIKTIIIINIVITIVFISIIGILLIRNNKEIHTWKNAIEGNESSAISNYIKQYPNGIFEKSAFQKMDEFTWNKALLSNSVESYREYKKTFPKGKFVSIAEELTQEFTDSRDGNFYKFVTIGNQVWMAENLKYLPEVVGATRGSDINPYYYVYDYDGTDVNAAKATANYSTYGVLYNWPAAMARSTSSTANPSGVQGVCPTGWHLPSDAEWTELTDYLGGRRVAGGRLKETGTVHWRSSNAGATNETGFTALPGGYRIYGEAFRSIGLEGYWQSASEYDTNIAWGRDVGHYGSNVHRSCYGNSKEFGFSVRCVRDYVTNSKGTGNGTTDSFATYQEDESAGTFTDSTDDGSKGTGYGTTDSFATYQEDESAVTFADSRDGNLYKFVTIGNQVWMAENLKYLPAVVGATTGSNTTPYYYVYDYEGTDVKAAKATSNYSTYGVLYNWPAAMAGSTSSEANPSGVQGVCPTGWHLPSDAEWTQLIDYLGGEEVAGGKLKETGTAHWDIPNGGATNETGFTALPGGVRNHHVTFLNIGSNGRWWSASQFNTYEVWNRGMSYSNSNVVRYSKYKIVGFSVRCVRD